MNASIMPWSQLFFSLRRYSLSCSNLLYNGVVNELALKIFISIGGPTVRLLFMVESMETSAAEVAVDREVCGVSTLSNIGFPYLLSPICRKGVSCEVKSGADYYGQSARR